ncbi:aminotransferase class V-fold PLP-dependent enzyme [Joostella atrarenae]|uniref:Aminotransferase class V-fold PLP-dependent enzyme n=1 Tax=Joostella atrarenae TaxID=679257 RepID=A0ABS9J365_9FLAO|nr:aminotransferase class I/II-fold pyridoxal phosphate-dependent enzyme [Joostella atrarenae]MCF8714882.1 aminotransferase class V-fold PLP-dependent enzyme [Joostella atrarenae]
MKDRIWLSSPHMGGGEQKYIDEAFASNWIAPLGPNVKGFEEDLKSFLATEKEVGALVSGTSAIHLALIQLGVKAGDEVICQSMTFSASANPILYQGAFPIFIDSEEETWNICPNQLEKAIIDRIKNNKKPKAMIIVHLYGMPAKMEAIIEISKKYEIPIVEDAAEALGSSYEQKMCGTFGDFAALSFNGNKIITTSGGGAIVCNNKQSKEKSIFLATQARDDAPHYQHSEVGYNYRMSNVTAGIGRGQMEVLSKHVSLRREMNEFYKNLFKNVKGVSVFQEPNENFFSNHWLSCILIDKDVAGFSREDLRLALIEENIESRPLWKPMHMQPVFINCNYYGDKVAENLFERGLCLPSGSNLNGQDRERIQKIVEKFVCL